MSLNYVVAQDLGNVALDAYERSDARLQTQQKKPFMAALRKHKKTFPNGLQVISLAVQGTMMSDTNGFVQGFTNDDQLNFEQSDNVVRPTYPWKEIHMGLIITFTELKIGGVSVNNDQKMSIHDRREANQLVELFKNRITDFEKSKETGMNQMFWDTGAQDGKQVPGLLSILTDTPTLGATGGLSRTANPWWQHIARVGNNRIVPSAQDQTLTQTITDDLLQAMRYGGEPRLFLCGSGYIRGLQTEVREKGLYTMTGFDHKEGTNIRMAEINIAGLGTFTYDPTMDLMGNSKRCYFIDPERLYMMPMEGEEDKKFVPARPYNYMVWLTSRTWTGGLVCDQLNCQIIHEVA